MVKQRPAEQCLLLGEWHSARAEAGRMAAVRHYEILDTPPDGAFDRVAALAARFLDTPVASVAIVDQDRIWFKSHARPGRGTGDRPGSRPVLIGNMLR